MSKYISEQIPLLTESQRATFELKKNNTTLKSANDVLNYLSATYEYWKTGGALADVWAVYESMHHDDFIKALDAWTSDYDPLHNYDGTEISFDVKKEGKTTLTNTPDSQRNKVTTRATVDAKTVVENDVTSYDSTTPRLDNKSTETPTGGTETIYDYKNTSDSERGETSMTIDGETIAGNDISYHKLTKGGNLGLTTSEQLIQQEVEMRLKPLIKMYLDTFIKEYAYCCE